MKVLQTVVRQSAVDERDFSALSALQPQLVMAFGSVQALQRGASAIAQAFPQAQRAGCSTAGEISARGVEDGTLVVTALHFDHARVAQVSTVLTSMEDSFAAGRRLATALPVVGLRPCPAPPARAGWPLQRLSRSWSCCQAVVQRHSQPFRATWPSPPRWPP